MDVVLILLNILDGFLWLDIVSIHLPFFMLFVCMLVTLKLENMHECLYVCMNLCACVCIVCVCVDIIIIRWIRIIHCFLKTAVCQIISHYWNSACSLAGIGCDSGDPIKCKMLQYMTGSSIGSFLSNSIIFFIICLL